MTDPLPPIEEVPAAHLTGRVLPNGWMVQELVAKSAGATGGLFSVAYRVADHEGREAFLKALNFHAALTTPGGSIIDRLQEFTTAYRFERDLLKDCTVRRMSRVIRLLDDGEIEVPEAGVISRVPYLILELADGDLRAFQQRLGRFDVAWFFRTMKHATVGVEQLHAAQTAHQDLKPSNVLTQNDGSEMKLGDLGRAERRNVDGPASTNPIPGAVAYAPPEQLYGAFGGHWEERCASDMYLLGSLAVQLVLGHTLSALLQGALSETFRFGKWAGDYATVLPYVTLAHANVMGAFEERLRLLIDLPDLEDELSEAVRQMTDPDPRRRGHPRDRVAQTSSHAVRRYVSLFNRLAARAEFRFLRA